jgi:hypothetical protein
MFNDDTAPALENTFRSRGKLKRCAPRQKEETEREVWGGLHFELCFVLLLFLCTHTGIQTSSQHLHAGDLFTQLLLTFAQHHFVPPAALPRWENQIVALEISQTENTLSLLNCKSL